MMLFNSLKYSGGGVSNKAVSVLDSFIYSLSIKQFLRPYKELAIGLCIGDRKWIRLWYFCWYYIIKIV